MKSIRTFLLSTSFFFLGAHILDAKPISFTPQLAPALPSGPKLVSATFAKDLAPNYSAKDPLTEPKFRVDDKKICLSMTFQNFTAKDTVDAIAYLGTDEIGRLSLPPSTTPIPINKNIYVGFCFPQEIFIVSNQYKIDVNLNGKFLGRFPFELRPVDEKSEVIQLVTFRKTATGEKFTTNKFFPNEQTLYARVQFKNPQSISSGKVVWSVVQVKDYPPNYKISETPLQIPIAETQSFHLKLPRNWPIGEYKIEAFVHDKLEASFPFSIIPPTESSTKVTP